LCYHKLMANLVKEEGGKRYWDNGIVTWARGNKEGKAPGSWVTRPPMALEALKNKAKSALKANGQGETKALENLTSGVASHIIRRGNETVRKQAAQAEAEAGLLRAGMSLSPLSPKLPAEAWGFIVEKQAEAAMSPDLGHSVRAAEFVGRATEYLAVEKGSGTHIDRMQVIVLDQDTAELLTQRGGLLLPDVVEGEFREPAETGGASDDG